MQAKSVQEGGESFDEHQDADCQKSPGSKEHINEYAADVAIITEAHRENHAP